MRFVALILFMLALAVAPLTAGAVATPTEHDPVAAKRAVGLSEQLRCLVCQNQSIAESNAELAVDLRRQIDEQIRAGKSDAEIIEFMTARYGDFVLYRPPFKVQTLLLWLGPALLAAAAIAGFGLTRRNRRRRVVQQPLSDAERAEAERLLASPVDGKTK
jgi:cytochrome c-type biogenesis protein CcmH